MPDVYGSGWVHLPVGLLTWLATTDLRLWVYGLRSIYGLTRFLHLFGMAGFLGLLLLLEVMRLGVFPGASLQPVRRPVIMLMNMTFVLTVATGILLFLYDPIGAGLHTMFLPKMILVTLGVVHAWYLERLKPMRHLLLR